MDKNQLYTRITLWVNRAVAVLLAVLIFLLPSILDWYSGFRYLNGGQRVHITASFYLCCGIIAVALWNLDRLLRNILAELVFVRQNVRAVRRIQWCCGAVAAVSGVACISYLPLVFLAVIMGFLCLVVAVVARVMEAAVSIREENDLTI